MPKNCPTEGKERHPGDERAFPGKLRQRVRPWAFRGRPV